MVPFPDAADRLSPSGPFLPTLTAVLVIFPLLNVGGVVHAIDNTFNVMGGSFADNDFVRTLTQVALWTPDPDAITEDPVIGWAGVVGGSNTIAIPGGPVAKNLAASWFIAFEIGEDSITQVCPTTLIPVPA